MTDRETTLVRISKEAHKELKKRSRGKTMTQVLDELLKKKES